MIIASWEDARALARRRLPKVFFDYIDGAAFSEATARANIEDFEAWQLNQRVLTNVATRDLTTTFLSATRPLPFMLGPVGFTGLFAPNGEILAARAAHAVGMPFCLSNNAIASLERLRAATDGPIWFQLYVLRERRLADMFLERAERAECEALVVTVDTAVGGIRERDLRSGFRSLKRITPSLAASLMTRPAWCARISSAGFPKIENLADYPQLGSYALEQASNLGAAIDPTFSWDDMQRIRERWKRKLVIKGILSAEDAVRCAGIGADGIVVSNHGGRQLDTAPSTIQVLPEIVAAAGSRLDVMLDGGIRRGAQIVKALALGAKGVMLGRAYAYALAAADQPGVATMIALLRQEIDVTIGHMGVARVADLHARREQVLRRRP